MARHDAPLMQQEPKVRRKQEHLIQEFTEHPVTVEINSGPHATNSSGLLGGYGNLFSFLGFESSSDPTGPIYKILQRKLKVSAIRKGYQGSYVVSVEMPSKEEILINTPFDWLEGRSWVDGIEKGVSGLGSYLYNEEGFSGEDLRSKTGIQIKGTLSGSKFRNTKYLSEMLNNFKKNLLK